MSYDTIECDFLGLKFVATHEQQRQVVARVRRLPEFREWHKLDSLIRTHHACADDRSIFELQLYAASATAAALAQAETNLTERTLEIIEQVLSS